MLRGAVHPQYIAQQREGDRDSLVLTPQGNNFPKQNKSSSNDARKTLTITFLLFVLTRIEFVHISAEVGRVAMERYFQRPKKFVPPPK